MRIKIIFHITRMDDVSDVLKKAEELKKEKSIISCSGQDKERYLKKTG